MSTHDTPSTRPGRFGDDRTGRTSDPRSTAAGRRSRPTDPEAVPPRGPLRRHGLLAYALLAYGISWPLLIGGYLTTEAGVLDPDGAAVWWIGQVAAAGPAIAAVVVVGLSRGRAGLAALGRSLVRWRVNPGWYVLAFLGIPLIMVAAVAAVFTGDILTALTADLSVLYTVVPLTILGLVLFTGLAEEPGWRGYAQPAANRRYQPLVAALVVSLVWALWHLPNALFDQTATETATHALLTVVSGFVLAWAYNATGGSVLVVMVLHASQNATYSVVRMLTEGADGAPSTAQYHLLYAAVFGVLMAVVAVRTRGRLGLPSEPAARPLGQPAPV